MTSTPSASAAQNTRGLFVTATDTGAGKTTLLCQLIAEFEKAGLPLCIRKPVESGCSISPDSHAPHRRLIAADAAALAAASQNLTVQQVCAYRLPQVCSPARAAQLEGIQLTIAQLVAACTAQDAERLLVEGAGGFYSPIACDGLNADLACALGLPLLMVIDDRLGCINHTLLTLEAAHRRQLKIAALVVNQATQMSAPDTDNYQELRTLTEVPAFKVGNGPVADDVKILAEHLIREMTLSEGS